MDADLNRPQDVAAGPDGSVYVADTDNRRIRRIRPDGRIVTAAGSAEYLEGDARGDGGPATAARFAYPTRVDVGPDGSLYILDGSDRRVRKVNSNGTISTIAGADPPPCPAPPEPGWNENGCGPGDPTLIAATTRAAAADGPVRGEQSESGPATDWVMDRPRSLTVGPDGSVYVAEWDRVRRITPAGRVFTVAGGVEYRPDNGDGGPARDAVVRHIKDVEVTARGELYIAEQGDGVRPDGRTIDYRYDTSGRLTSIGTPSGATTVTYDGTANRPAIIDGPGAERLTFDWDGPLPEGVTASGTVSGRSGRSYDDDLQVASVTTRGQSIDLDHDDDGLLTRAGELTLERDPASGRLTRKQYRLLRFKPDATETDAWISEDLRLCVSDRMLEVLKRGDLHGCDIERLD